MRRAEPSGRRRQAGPLGRVLGIVLAALSFALGACARGAGEPAVATSAGCYRFERNEGADHLGLPWGIVLEAEPLEAGWPLVERFDGVRVARTATSAGGRADHPFGYWRPTAADSMEVGHPGGGGIVLVLAPEGRDLVGSGRAAGDALGPGRASGPRPPMAIVAHRVPCGTP